MILRSVGHRSNHVDLEIDLISKSRLLHVRS